jgi:hypothetical protein
MKPLSARSFLYPNSFYSRSKDSKKEQSIPYRISGVALFFAILLSSLNIYAQNGPYGRSWGILFPSGNYGWYYFDVGGGSYNCCRDVTIFAFPGVEPDDPGYYYTYQWEVYTNPVQGWHTISGETSMSLYIDDASSCYGPTYMTPWKYQCHIYRRYTVGTVQSHWYTDDVTILYDYDEPTIESSTNYDLAPCVGNEITFSITPGLGCNNKYQWYSSPNGSSWSPISGETSATLDFIVGTGDDGYYYRCKISNACSQSDLFGNQNHIDVWTPPEITGQTNDNITVCSGKSATFQVSANGTAPNYQWYKNTIPVGTNSNTYTNNNVQPGDAGNYKCVVSNKCGSDESVPRALIVNIPLTINADPLDDEVCEGDPVSFSVNVTGTLPITYQWQVSTDGGNSWSDIYGETNATLEFDAQAGEDGYLYKCLVTNPCTPNDESGVALLSVIEKPRITAQPNSLIKCVGQSGTLTLSATGTDLDYQWYKNGTPIPGANQSNYVNNNIQTGDNGNYTCLVSN